MEDQNQSSIPKARMVRVYTGTGGDDAILTRNYRAVVDADDPSILHGMVSKTYRMVQHEDFLYRLESAIKANPEFGRWERTLHFPKDGCIMEASYRFPEVAVHIDGRHGKDTVNPRIVAKNGHDGMTNLEMLVGAFQTFCWNGLVIGKKMMQTKNMHVQMLNMDRIMVHLDTSLHMFSEQCEIWKGWVDKLVDYDEYKDIMETTALPQKDNKEIIAEVNKYEEVVDPESNEITPGQKVLTMWAFYSIFTAYATHKVKNNIKRMDLDMRISRAFGKY